MNTTHEETINRLRAAGVRPVPGPFDLTWSMDVDGCEIRFGVPPDGIGWAAWWVGLDPDDHVKARGFGIVAAFKVLVHRLVDARSVPGSAAAARRLNDFVAHMERL